MINNNILFFEIDARSRSLFLRFLLVCMYSITLCMLPMDAFMDRDNYLNYAMWPDVIFDRYLEGGILSILENEPIWLGINYILSSVFPPETIVRIIIFFSSFITSWVVLAVKPQKLLLSILILIFPMVVKNYIIHLRQGFALSVLLLSVVINNRCLKSLLILSTPFIHASYFCVLFIALFTSSLKKLKLSANTINIFFAIASLIFSLLLNELLTYFMFRQKDAHHLTVTNISGFGFVFWFFLLTVMYCEGKQFLKSHIFEINSLLFYLSTYFLLSLSARIFESVVALVLLSGRYLTNWRYNIFILSLACYCGLYYFLRLELPWLGFGV